MNKAQLEILSNLGQALWVDVSAFQKAAAETIAAVALMDLTEERALERISSLLLRQAMQDGPGAHSRLAHQAFYRMLPEERFILSALHQGHWSYARIARVVDKSIDEITELAWSARLHLASLPGKTLYAPTPTGSRKTENCPDYDARRPWTQKFLDREFTPNEQIFFQTHLENCESCRQSLSRSRAIYYAVDALIPRTSIDDSAVGLFEAALKQGRVLRGLEGQSFKYSILHFLQSRDVQFMLLALILVLIVSLGR